MTKLSTLLLVGLVVTAAALPAKAAIYSTSFTGNVTNSTNTTNAVGSTITGSFTYSSDTSQYLNFSIDGFSATQPFISVATTITGGAINPISAFYAANQSVTQGTGTTNRTFTLDLEALTNFGTNNALALLTTPNLFSLLDTTTIGSDFSYVNSSATGTGTTNLVATLTSLSTTVPEPASLALLAAPVLGMVFRRRR